MPLILARVSERSSDALRDMRARLDGLTIRDSVRLGRRLKGIRNDQALKKFAEQLAAAESLVATRVASVPTITYPELPVSERRGEIAEAIEVSPS